MRLPMATHHETARSVAHTSSFGLTDFGKRMWLLSNFGPLANFGPSARPCIRWTTTNRIVSLQKPFSLTSGSHNASSDRSLHNYPQSSKVPQLLSLPE